MSRICANRWVIKFISRQCKSSWDCFRGRQLKTILLDDQESLIRQKSVLMQVVSSVIWCQANYSRFFNDTYLYSSSKYVKARFVTVSLLENEVRRTSVDLTYPWKFLIAIKKLIFDFSFIDKYFSVNYLTQIQKVVIKSRIIWREKKYK